ncbi:hypothetical protein TWF569_002421 [Orbilia oligospora]|uniref:Dynamin-type G domain-containing protein n=1 Tax=Orbilia oligospora TaxID=2813651 RepID=A0A7C8NXU5_ORBOL|nr:hypothetical protein TWF103_005939 [Orbilia oligospora]KAF3109857.1 hypothetical protein TWF102_009124 [Orbilia oligospora]KAF3116935.1 hypothetical protein TWF706_000149 [Orbilia oligospora]KAF3140350.1 hypothetical protein TWF594_006321 [Orbilia oligospora]KAF3145710.1 hypothetical protein TWF703_006852 [Orbilia oligospora]
MSQARRQNFSNLEALDSAARSQLFDIIDRFRELNISEDISLPQLVVVGDQSSGKSSLLEGLTEISFPVASDLCTRFATQIVLRRADDDEGHVRASIIPGADANLDLDLRDKLLEFQVSLTEAEFGPESFAKILDEAAEYMGIPKPGDKVEDTPDKRFSNDILKIELSGPHHPHLTIVDVPGLFHNSTIYQTDEDKDLIRNLIQTYIKDPRTIIMAVMDGRNNLANQEVFRMAREVDPEGRRTVGIITKCDAVQPGDENGVIQIASNKVEKLHHGWFAVRNRSTKEIQDGVTIQQRHIKEKEFFRKAPWSRLGRDRTGIENLKPFLGHLLYEHVRDEFPKLVDEINRLVIETEDSLAQLGIARTTPTEQRIYLTKIANEYERSVTDCLDAKFREQIDSKSPLKIRTRIQNMNSDFAKRMQIEGHTREFKDEDEEPKPEEPDEITPPEIPFTRHEREEHQVYGYKNKEVDGENFRSKLDPEDIYDWIKVTYRDSRGPELPGLVNYNVVIQMFREQSTNWKTVAGEHVRRVVDIVAKFNAEVFNRVVSDDTVRKKLQTSLSKATGAAITQAYRELDQLIEDERSGILQTVNVSFGQNQKTMRQKRALCELKKQRGENGMVNLNIVAQMFNLSNEDTTVRDVHDILKSYYDISLRRFTDNVVLQVVERHLLGKNGPVRLLKSEYVSGLEDLELRNIACEDYQAAAKRRELQARLERAKGAQEAASIIPF